MRMLRRECAGFILIFTLMFISMMMGLATYVFVKGQVYTPYMRAMIDRDKARTLALGGVQVAFGQLTYFPAPEKKQESGTKQEVSSWPIKRLLERVLPVLNRWQNFVLTQDVDGIDAKLRICITAACGKINLNQLYDFQKHRFKGEGSPTGDMKKIAQNLCELLQKATGRSDLFTALEAYLKKRSYPLNDSTELLTDQSFAFFKNNLFYEPPAAQASSAKRPLYLTDVFTVWSGTESLDPLLLSDSVCGLFYFKRVTYNDTQARKDTIAKLLKAGLVQNPSPEQIKKIMVQIYGKDFTTLPKSIHSILRLAGEPLVFDVLSSATVNGVTQQVYAIIVCTSAQEREGVVSFKGKILKVYWL